MSFSVRLALTPVAGVKSYYYHCHINGVYSFSLAKLLQKILSSLNVDDLSILDLKPGIFPAEDLLQSRFEPWPQKCTLISCLSGIIG